ncbi:hypothetical protein ACFL6P_05810 [Candidatus Latescibacterota bacterium]
MLDTLARNLWLLLTLVIPGFFTYGVWRIFLILEPSTRLNINTLNKIDSSAIVSVSIIISIALIQQAFAITIEAILTLLAKVRKKKWPNFYSLFCERFKIAAAGALDEDATRIIGNMFLSINMTVGLSLLFIYFMAYEDMCVKHWIPISIIVLFIATLITTIFRIFNAKWTIEKCKKINQGNSHE